MAITPAPAFTASDLSAPAGANWIVVDGNLAAQNFSSLNQLTTTNAAGLQLAWSTHLGGLCTATNVSCGAEANPLVYQGVMYVEDGAGSTSAIDATTGTHIWDYAPAYDPTFKKKGDVTRGIAMGGGQIYIPRMDASVVALNQQTGGVGWFGQPDNGPWQLGYHALTSAPVFYDNMVIVGMSGGDSGNSDFMVVLYAPEWTHSVALECHPGPRPTGLQDVGQQEARTTTLAARSGTRFRSTRSSISSTSGRGIRFHGTRGRRARSSGRTLSSP